jgi:hypothetical protein
MLTGRMIGRILVLVQIPRNQSDNWMVIVCCIMVESSWNLTMNPLFIVISGTHWRDGELSDQLETWNWSVWDLIRIFLSDDNYFKFSRNVDLFCLKLKHTTGKQYHFISKYSMEFNIIRKTSDQIQYQLRNFGSDSIDLFWNKRNINRKLQIRFNINRKLSERIRNISLFIFSWLNSNKCAVMFSR